MRARIGLAVAVVAAVLAAACGSNSSCPTAAANAEHQNMSGACSGPSQQVTVNVNLCEACSHTAPTCVPDLQAVDTANKNGTVWLDLRWEICSDNSSCASKACGSVTCQFGVPSGGSYSVQTNGVAGQAAFQLDTTGATASCSGVI